MLQTVLAQRRLATSALPSVPRVPRAGGLLDAFDAGAEVTAVCSAARLELVRGLGAVPSPASSTAVPRPSWRGSSSAMPASARASGETGA